MDIKTLFLYLNTLRHLKPHQIWGRIFFHLFPPRIRPVKIPHVHYAPLPLVSIPSRRGLLLGPRKFCFLNQVGILDGPVAWNDSGKDLLWRFNLHYFHYLFDENALEHPWWAETLIENWIDHNPIPKGCGWSPYPLSLRIVNWVKYFHTRPANDKFIHSLAAQVAYLSKRIEYHLMGNHLFVNGKALIFGGLFFSAKDGFGKKIYDAGMKLVEKQFLEQVKPDGSNFEQSPMYHGIFLEDVLDLLNILTAYKRPIPAGWQTRIEKMLRFYLDLSHPDGEIAFFNDAVMNIAPPARQLLEYAARLGLQPAAGKKPVQFFPDAGFARLERDDAVLLIDGGPTGPDYVFSHAHSDNLSFEISYKDRRVLVNSGVSCYGQSQERQYQRSTAAHNTIEIDAQDQSETWGGFRLARRAYPLYCQAGEHEGQLYFKGAHNGYRRLGGNLVHHREFFWTEHQLKIVDHLQGRKNHRVSAHFHFHPDFVLQECAHGIRLTGPLGENLLIKYSPPFVHQIQPCFWHPEFGKSIPTRKLILSTTGVFPLKLVTEIFFL